MLWQREVPRRQKGRLQNVNGPASPSPVTDGASVYVFFQDFGLLAFSADGAELWRLPLGPFSMFYGFGASPILVDDAIILPVDQDGGSYLVSVDKKTGKVRWKVDRPGVISGYSTPTVYEPASGPKQVVIPESFQLSAYSVADGSARVVGARPAVRDEVGGQLRSRVSLRQRVGLSAEPARAAGRDRAVRGRTEALRPATATASSAATEVSGTEPMDKMLAPSYGFDAFDLDRDGRLRREGVGRLPADDGVGERLAGHQARRPRRHDRDGHPLALPAAGAAGAFDAALPGRRSSW